MVSIGDIASATAGNLDLGQELAFVDDQHVQVGSQGLGPYGRVHPGRPATHHNQRLPLLLLLLRAVMDGRRGANRGGGEALVPAENERGGAASGGGGGLEPRPMRHFVEQWSGGVDGSFF